MALVSCPDCAGKVSDRALACPSCGHPFAEARPRGAGGSPGEWPAVVGGVAGTYISARALTTTVVGCVMFLGFVAIMVALIVS